MDIKAISSVLESTLSPTKEIREAAEVQLARFQTVPGFTSALFQLLNTADVNLAIRQSGSILFKHLTKTRWGKPPEPNEPLLFPDDVKRAIKDALLQSICSAPPMIRVQLGVCLTDIMTYDYPAQWPSLIPQCLQLVASRNPALIDGALYALRMVTKRYEWCSSQNEKRQELYEVVQHTFPVLLELFKFLLTLNTMEAIHMQTLVVKTVWSATQFGMPPFLASEERFTPWLVLLLQVLERPVPQPGPDSGDEKEKWGPWVIKKWVATLFDRLFQRFAVERQRDNEHNQLFSKVFMNSYVLKLLESVLNVLNGPYAKILPRKLKTALLNYLNNSVYYSKTWKMVKPHLDKIFQSVLFPILVWEPSDLEIFSSDPHEYIRQQFDYVAEFSDPRVAVSQFLLDTVHLRGDSYLVVFMQNLVQVLARFATAEQQSKNYAEKDAALVVIGNLAPVLKKSPTFKNNLEEMLLLHVIPELRSPLGFMRARAVWVFGQFYNVKMQKPELFVESVQFAVNLINDSELPVRVYSALALHFLIKSKLIKPKMETILPQLIEAYLKLMGEIDNDDLVGALQSLIQRYSKQVSALAPPIAHRLVEQYMKLISRGNELFDDDDQTGMLTAMQLLKALQSLLLSTKDNQALLTQLQPLIRNLLLTIHPGLVDMFTDYIQILAMYTFYSGSIAPDTWDIFIKFADCYLDWAGDFSGELLIPFDNFISKNTDVFLSNPIFLQKICQMYQTTVQNPQSPETDAGSICTLMEVVLVYCAGRVDGIIPEVLRIAVERLEVADLPPFKVLLIEVFANCLLYNPGMTIAVVESKGWTQKLFANWFQLLNEHFTRLHDVKLTILAFTSLLKLPFMSWPPSLRGELKNIVATTMELIFKYTKEKQEREDKLAKIKAEIEKAGIGSDDEDEDDDEESEEDGEDLPALVDDDDDDAIQAQADNLLKKGNRVLQDEEDITPTDGFADKLMSAYLGSDDDDDDDFDLEDDDEFEVKSDQIDEVIFFCENFSGFTQRDPQVYEALVKALSDVEKEKLSFLAGEANKRVEKNKQQPKQ